MKKFDRCILCNNFNFRTIYQKDHWQYLRCLNCDLVSLYPRPSQDELMSNYRDYLPIQPKEIEAWEIMMKPVIVKSANLIESRVRAGSRRLLDIGCGYGFFLKEMESRGWMVEGIEISQTGRQYAHDKWDIHVHSQPLEDLSIPENSFDVITLFYVIEHVLDPLSLLMEVKRVIKPGGLILLRWPHSTPIVRMLGPLAQKLDLYHTPYHLYDFSPKTMEKILRTCGVAEIETMILGNTRTPNRFARWVSVIFGGLGEALCYLSRRNLLLPGISKTTLAIKPT
jgi:2-polyprenyl-3-methyl-5-hydroxy-6-metoxy-1,4-benzoquinol methylase